MLAGAYPSDEFAELKPRITWDRVTDAIEGRRDARVVAVTSGGTIPDRGLYGVFMVGEAGTPGRRVGELDEEMVYESRAGEVITLGASSWRIEEIGHDRVTVSPAPGVPGKLPFWHGDALGRPIELGSGAGGLRPRDRGRPGPRRPRPEVGERPPEGGPRPRRPRGREPARLPRGRARGRRRPADGPADRGRALPGRARRLAARAADAVRRPRPRAVVAWPSRRGSARSSGPRSRRSGPTTGSRSACPTQRSRSRAWPTCCSRIPRRSRTWSSGRSRHPRCSRRGSARTRRGRCSCPVAGPGRGRRSGSSASEPRTCSRSRLATAASRSSSRRIARCCRTSSTCRHCARCWAASRAGRSRSTASRPSARARSRARCCSTTWPRTCTTATRPWPSGGRAR